MNLLRAPLPTNIKITKIKNRMLRVFWLTGTLATTKTKRTTAKTSKIISKMSMLISFGIIQSQIQYQ